MAPEFAVPGGRKSRSRKNLLQLARPDDSINFRNVLANLVAVTLDKTSRHNELTGGPGSLMLRHFEDGIDRFLFGRIDEGAGIDDQDFGVSRIRGHLGARAVQQSHHHLAVNQVFGAAERDKPYLRAARGSCGIC